MKSEEGNDSHHTFIRQAIGKQPVIYFPRTGDNPVQWTQLHHALDQPDLVGWPLMTPIKVQIQKCEKCSQEYYSPINYRRHIRVHRRSLNVNKESHKNRGLLAAFWDKLSLEEAKKVVSFNGVMLKEIPGLSVIRALASSLRNPGVWILPQVYVSAGSSLLDIIQAKPSRLRISSQELFGTLDDASERTFLCAGTPESVQKYLFDGEAAKNSLDLINVIATTSFLFEQQLVKAWVADKDAEALRCQKLLVEEEEAAKKRSAGLLERKKQKKLRQKERKLKEQFHRCKGDLNVAVDAADTPVLAKASGPLSPSDSTSNSIDGPTNLGSCLESLQLQSQDPEKDIEAQNDFSGECINQEDSRACEPQMMGEHNLQQLATNSWQILNPLKRSQYGINVSQNAHTRNPESIQVTSLSKERALINESKVWTKKEGAESHGERLQPSSQVGISHRMEETNCEVIIGSIPIPVNSYAAEQQHFYPNDAQDTCGQHPAMLRNNPKKLIKSDTVQSTTNQFGSKVWRPVSSRKTKGTSSVERGNKDSEGVAVLKKVGDQIMPSERCMPSESTHDDCDNHDHVPSDGNGLQRIDPFTIIAAKEFLAQRWKEAISGDHVKLVLSPGHEPSFCLDVQQDNSTTS